MKKYGQDGWVLFEVGLAMACVMGVLTLAHNQEHQINLQVSSYHQEAVKAQQQNFQKQIDRSFHLSLESSDSSSLQPPSCQICRGSQLKHLLEYELATW